MSRLLVANGCSYTAGSELEDPEREAWPSILAERLGLACVNLAQGGTSNRRMVRSTVLGLPRILADEEVSPSETLVVLAWTDISRYEYHSDTESPSRENLGASAAYDLDHAWHRIGPWRRKNRHKPSRAFYSHLWSLEGQWINFALDWLLLDHLLRSEGYSARYTFVAPPTCSMPQMAADLAARLDPSTVWGGFPPDPERTFEGVAQKVPRGARGHPLAEGHVSFAEALAAWLADRST